ncbi:MAG: hypothetical protein ABR955_05400 [Verrucomicrobiota bacterium]
MNTADTVPLMLLAVHMLALGVACGIFVWMIVLHRRAHALNQSFDQIQKLPPLHSQSARRPVNWLAIRSLEPEAVRMVLANEDEFFISQRVNGWVIVTGPGLPNPGDDVDECFRFLAVLSRKLGHVQFFHAEKFSAHHAWVRMDDAYVTRAYAWAGETVWNQGAKTMAEIEMGMKCFGYGENSDAEFWTTNESAVENMEKVSLLASRWSIDPVILHRADGITGESSRLY